MARGMRKSETVRDTAVPVTNVRLTDNHASTHLDIGVYAASVSDVDPEIIKRHLDEMLLGDQHLVEVSLDDFWVDIAHGGSIAPDIQVRRGMVVRQPNVSNGHGRVSNRFRLPHPARHT